MKTILRALSAMIFLLFGYGLQAQSSVIDARTSNPIISYQEQLGKLSQQDAEDFENRVKAVVPTMTIHHKSGKIIIYGGDEYSSILRLKLNNPEDFSRIIQAHPKVLETVEMLSVRAESASQNWFSNSEDLLGLKNLNTIYIESYEKLTTQKIQRDFKNLLNVLKVFPDAEIIYESLSQPQ